MLSGKTNSKQESKEIREEIARKEQKEIFQKREENIDKRTKDHKFREEEESIIEQVNRVSKQVNNSNSITIWDLFTQMKRSLVFKIVRFIGRVKHIS